MKRKTRRKRNKSGAVESTTKVLFVAALAPAAVRAAEARP